MSGTWYAISKDPRCDEECTGGTNEFTLHAGLLGKQEAEAAISTDMQLQAWVLALDMLEDEDVDVRQSSARCVGSSLPCLGGPSLTSARVEYVQQQAWHFMAAYFTDQAGWAKFLLERIWR